MNEFVPHIMKNRRGFTLVETLVAITILLFAVAGPLSIAARSLFAANVAKDQITMFYLTQQAMETVRNIRDQNVLRNQDWLTGFSECGNNNSLGGNSCKVDARNNSIIPCGVDGCGPIKFDSTGDGLYGYSSAWLVSPYTIDVHIATIDALKEISIQVTGSWKSGPISRFFFVREHLFRWE